MADWSKPALASSYANFVTETNARDADLAVMFDPAVVTPTNFPTSTVRWRSAANKWEKWNGTVWSDLAATYAISISGNAATASALSSAPGSVLEVGRYFDFHSAANGYDYDVRLDAQAGASAGAGTLVITASNVAATLFTGALAGNATTATNAWGATFGTQGTTSEGQLIARKNGQNDAYLFNNDSAWGLYSASGGTMVSYDRATAKFYFNGNAATATSAANGGVTSVNGQTGAVTIATTDATKLPLTGGMLSGDLTTYREGAPATGVVFFGNSGARYLYYDGTNYQMPGADLVLNGRAVNAAIDGKAAVSHAHSDYVSTNMTHGAVGSLCFAVRMDTGAAVAAGSTLAGSSLSPASVERTANISGAPGTDLMVNESGTLSGTWRCLGYSSSAVEEPNATLWQRIS